MDSEKPIIKNNEVIKYYAKEIEGNIYLIPLQPNMKNPLKGLPVIKLGLLYSK